MIFKVRRMAVGKRNISHAIGTLQIFILCHLVTQQRERESDVKGASSANVKERKKEREREREREREAI